MERAAACTHDDVEELGDALGDGRGGGREPEAVDPGALVEVGCLAGAERYEPVVAVLVRHLEAVDGPVLGDVSSLLWARPGNAARQRALFGGHPLRQVDRRAVASGRREGVPNSVTCGCHRRRRRQQVARAQGRQRVPTRARHRRCQGRRRTQGRQSVRAHLHAPCRLLGHSSGLQHYAVPAHPVPLTPCIVPNPPSPQAQLLLARSSVTASFRWRQVAAEVLQACKIQIHRSVDP